RDVVKERVQRQHGQAAQKQLCQRAADVLRGPVPVEIVWAGEVRGYVARANGADQVPPAPDGDVRDQGLGQAGIRDRVAHGVARHVLARAKQRQQHVGAQQPEKGIGGQSRQRGGTISQLSLKGEAYQGEVQSLVLREGADLTVVVALALALDLRQQFEAR